MACQALKYWAQTQNFVLVKPPITPRSGDLKGSQSQMFAVKMQPLAKKIVNNLVEFAIS